MQLLNFNIIRLFVFLVIGILLAHYLGLDLGLVLRITLILTLCLTACWLALRHSKVKQVFFGIIVYLTVASIGSAVYLLHNDINDKNHYSKLLTTNENYQILLQIEKRLKPDTYNEKFFAEVININDSAVSGRLLVNVSKDSINHILPVDALLVVNSQIRPIQAPLNPHQFDYRNYLKLQNVNHQVYLNKSDFKILDRKPKTLFGWAHQLRKTINIRLKDAGFGSESMSIINAMLLGQRQDIDKSIYNNYINSGTVHILAVSGLHVGIILLILNALFRPLLRLKHGRLLRPAIIVLLLWLFALVAGFSPSVTRAVIMFSVISIAMHLNRPTNIFNTLVISAFLILLFKPNLLFQVGFQLSYLAVIGIVSIQPLIFGLFTPKYYVLNKLWEVFTVTVAAQLGVLPISLLYFHQFPGLFFISNVIVVPLLGIILGIGLLVIVLGLLSALPTFLVSIYSWVIETLNDFIAWVANFENFLFRDIAFDGLRLVCFYIIIFCSIQSIKLRSAKYFILSLIAIIYIQINTVRENISLEKEALIVFNKSRNTILAFHKKQSLYVYSNLDSSSLAKDNILKNYKVGESIESIDYSPLGNIYEINDNRLLIVDSSGVYNPFFFKPKYVLLRNSPKINLNRLIDSLNPKTILADASNYKSYIARWKRTCKAKHQVFHYTNEDGAYIINYLTP